MLKKPILPRSRFQYWKEIKLLLLGLLFLNNSSWGQETKVDNLIPASPDAAALGKYAQIPVGYYTGVPNISIRLVDVIDGNIDLPVYLSYHTSNKVDEIAPRTGIGWVLNGGGTITRLMAGEPDESPMGFLNTTYSFSEAEIMNGTSQTPKFILWRGLVDCADAEPDQFAFNFHGYTGMFSFEWNSDQNFDIRVNSNTRMKVVALDGAGNEWYHGHYTTPISGFKITTADGMVYLFRSFEETYNRVLYRYYPNSQYNCRGAVQGGEGFFPVPTITSWHLTKIISPAGGEISLNYTDYDLEYRLRESEITHHRYGCWPQSGYRSEKARILVHGKYLSSITTSTGNTIVEFNPSDSPRSDLPFRNDSTSNTLYGLGGIKVLTKSGGTYKVTKHYRLNYNYEVGRLTLKTLEELPIDENEVLSHPPHLFSYNTEVIFPPVYDDNDRRLVGSFQQDHWGYYNTNPKTTLIPAYVASDCGPNPPVFEGADRSPNPERTKAGILTQIQYPTGGTTTFEYEPHGYGAVGNIDSNPNKISGGSRIKRITENPGDGGIGIVRKFKYEMPDGRSSGVLSIEPEYAYWTFTYDYQNVTPLVQIPVFQSGDWDLVWGSPPYANDATWNVQGGPGEIQDFITRSATSLLPMGMTQGNHIGYRQVTVLYGENGEGGKSDFYFSSFYDHNDNYSKSSDLPLPPPITYDYQRGLLTKQIEFKFDNGNYVPVKQIENQYDSTKFELVGIKVGEQFPGGSAPNVNMFSVSRYSIIYGISALVHSTETTFENGQSLTTERYNQYDPSLQFIRQQVIKKSNSKELKTEYNYPFDYNTNPSAAIIAMQERYILSPVVEKIVKERDSNGIEKVIGGEFIQFDIFNNHIYPSQQFHITTETPIGDFQPSVVSGSFDSRYYSNELSYSSYNSMGRPQQIIKRGDIKTSYIWGYDGRLLAAKAFNTQFSRCAFSSFETEELGNWNYSLSAIYSSDSKTGNRSFKGTVTSAAVSAGDYTVSLWAKNLGGVNITVNGITKTIDGSWKRYEWILTNPGTVTINTNGNLIDDLRLHPKEARMKTFTYEPGIGITSETSENHIPIFYEYDAFGRLKIIRDQDGNIVKHYRYQYRAN